MRWKSVPIVRRRLFNKATYLSIACSLLFLGLGGGLSFGQEVKKPKTPLLEFVDTIQGLPITFRADLTYRAVETAKLAKATKIELAKELFRSATQLPSKVSLEALDPKGDTLPVQLALLSQLRLDALSVRLRVVDWMLAHDRSAAVDLFETIPLDEIQGGCKESLAPDFSGYYGTLARILEALPRDRSVALLMRHVTEASSACQFVPLMRYLASASSEYLPAASALPGTMYRAGGPSCFALLRKDDRLEKAQQALVRRFLESGVDSTEFDAACARFRKRLGEVKLCETSPDPMPTQPTGLVSRLLELRRQRPETTPPWVEEYVSSSLSQIELWHPKDSCALCTFFAKTELFLALVGLVPDEMQHKVAERYLRFLEASPECVNHPIAWLSRFQPVLRLLRTPSDGELRKLDDLRKRGYVLNFLPSNDAAGLRDMFARSANPVIAAYLEAEKLIPVPFLAPEPPK